MASLRTFGVRYENTKMMKAKGKESVRKAVEYYYPIMPVRFFAIHLVKLVARRIGRPDVYADSCLRKLRELKEEGKINFKCVDKLRSQYLKLPVGIVENI